MLGQLAAASCTFSDANLRKKTECMVGRLTKSNSIGGEILKQTALIGYSLGRGKQYKPLQTCTKLCIRVKNHRCRGLYRIFLRYLHKPMSLIIRVNIVYKSYVRSKCTENQRITICKLLQTMLLSNN